MTIREDLAQFDSFINPTLYPKIIIAFIMHACHVLRMNVQFTLHTQAIGNVVYRGNCPTGTIFLISGVDVCRNVLRNSK